MKEIALHKLQGQVSWDQLFDSEQELINNMMKCETVRGLVPKGYEYLDIFKWCYKKNGRLTERQLTQLKRLAAPVYAYVNNLLIGDLLVRI